MDPSYCTVPMTIVCLENLISIINSVSRIFPNIMSYLTHVSLSTWFAHVIIFFRINYSRPKSTLTVFVVVKLHDWVVHDIVIYILCLIFDVIISHYGGSSCTIQYNLKGFRIFLYMKIIHTQMQIGKNKKHFFVSFVGLYIYFINKNPFTAFKYLLCPRTYQIHSLDDLSHQGSFQFFLRV